MSQIGWRLLVQAIRQTQPVRCVGSTLVGREFTAKPACFTGTRIVKWWSWGGGGLRNCFYCQLCLHFWFRCALYNYTNSMEHSPSWEANRSSATQESPRILWNPKVHYRIHKSLSITCPYPESDLSSSCPPSLPQSHFSKIHFIIILSSTPGSIMWSPSFRCPHLSSPSRKKGGAPEPVWTCSRRNTSLARDENRSANCEIHLQRNLGITS
jgi:hypothetical protein